MVDILEYAMQVEKEGEAHYRKLAERSSNPGLKKILIEMAESEVEHYNIFQAFKEHANIPTLNDAIFPHVKDIFSGMTLDPSMEVKSDEIALFRQIQIHEKKSQEFYQNKAQEVDDPILKEMLLKIADEEGKHYQVLGGLIDFLSNPAQWLADAEWNHISDY
ncbi:MAG: ferritin family protein [Thiomargarita sp.]|nr:ferritin family protein [Thiomargarita sp.]